MKKLIILLALAFAMPAFGAGILTEAYQDDLKINIEELEAVIDAGLGTDRDAFMLKYYKKKLVQVEVESAGTPSRTQFTSGISNKEPVDSLKTVSARSQQISFFSELVNLSGTVATHRWSFRGDVVYSKDFRVGADRWRVWSTKTITPYVGGVIVVQILVDGEVYTQESVRITN